MRSTRSRRWSLLLAVIVAACSTPDGRKPDVASEHVGDEKPESTAESSASPPPTFDGEVRLSNLRQLTHEGDNAEAYFDGAGDGLIFQATREGFQCDQTFRMKADGSQVRVVSTGLGRTTCGFIFPDGGDIIYTSTHRERKTCPPPPDDAHGYVWPLLPELDIYRAGPDGSNPTPLAPHPGYDAEGVISPQGDRIVFTSTRGGDIDIWSMAPDGTDLKQLTNRKGYDGGAFFSRDGERIVYRAHYPESEEEIRAYEELLADDLVRPHVMDLWVMDADGSNKQKILANGAANSAPYFHPDGERIIFASNMDDPGGRDFDLFIIGVDGSGLERVTFGPTLDASPMFSYDGSRLVFASDRGGRDEGDTDIFVADWTDDVPKGPEDSLADDGEIAASTWLDRASHLGDESYRGRAVGTPELEMAASWIVEQFESVGLQPAGRRGFRQPFEMPVSSSVKEAAFDVDGKKLEHDDDFRVFPFSGSGEASGQAVFVGYGITSPDHDYDDYAGVDVDAKIAVALRYEPQRGDSDSRFAGAEPMRLSDLTFKAINAEHHGASALVVINPRPRDDEEDELHAFSDAPSAVGIPVVHLTWESAGEVFDAGYLDALSRKIDRSGKPHSAPLDRTVNVSAEIEKVEVEVTNIVGKLPATLGGGGERAIVVGAHYDHLGSRGGGSLAPDEDAVHPGADDNASGVASLIELAEALRGAERRVDVYFVAFTAEESGLLGSHHFVANAPVSPDAIDAMLNFDMVGRLDGGPLTVFGYSTGQTFDDTLRRAALGLPLELRLRPDGFGPSDHMAFYQHDIPVLHFFTGAHEDYHRPTDTADKLDARGGALVTTFAFRVVQELAVRVEPPAFVESSTPHGGDHGADDVRNADADPTRSGH